MIPLLAFGLPSGSEWLLIGALALLFFGSERIPQLARAVGRSINEFKRGRSEDDSQHELDDKDDDDKKPRLDDRQK
jgi:sec-independent protein translocase protein TatA